MNLQSFHAKACLRIAASAKAGAKSLRNSAFEALFEFNSPSVRVLTNGKKKLKLVGDTSLGKA